MCATPAPVVGYIVPAPTVFSVASAPGENPSASGYVHCGNASGIFRGSGPAPDASCQTPLAGLLISNNGGGSFSLLFTDISLLRLSISAASERLAATRNLGIGHGSLVFYFSVRTARLPNAVLGVGSRLQAAGARACDSRPRASLKRSFWGGLEWSPNFDTSCAERQIPGCARVLKRKQLVSGSAQIRSSLKADKRGRSQVFDSILEGASKPQLRSASTDLLSAPNWLFRLGS